MFEQRLSELRKEKGLSQYELAKRLNFTRGQVANYEQGKRQPSFDIAKKISDYFDVSVDFLLGHTDVRKITSDSSEKIILKKSEQETELEKLLEPYQEDKEFIEFIKTLKALPEDVQKTIFEQAKLMHKHLPKK